VSKKSDAKNKAALWNDFYKRAKLSKAEVDSIKHQLVIRGVDQHRINPKSVDNIQLFGEINKETYVWNEGLLSSIFRQYSKDHTSKKKWIVLDGPIDYIWVENLNSVLDDNQKLNLVSGETLKMSEGMCMLLETDNLRNVTPATISRCGLVFMNKQEVNRPK
jgi:dynein heavy chain, axonemal